jgi:hypothetical protein
VPTWPHHIAVYGPPGAGKTSLVETATAHGFPALDLEDVGGNYSERQTFLKELADGGPRMLLGAADLTPEDLPTGTRLVLLAPSDTELIRRVRTRGDRRGHKWVESALQVLGEHRLMAEAGAFDLVLEGDDTPDEVLRTIVAWLANA